MKTSIVFMLVIMVLLTWFFPAQAKSKEQEREELPAYLKDRGQEIPTSMFGTYINRGELLFYPFFEYYHDHNMEYAPNELGFDLDTDFRGSYRAYEGLVFLCYGLTDNISVEVEAAVIDATLEKSPEDPSPLPYKISKSGLGDVQMQFNWLWKKETIRRAGFFSYAEVVFPFNKGKILIGTSDWEFKVGTGVIRGFSWGTMVVRAAVEYSMEESKFDIGEVAVEYLKRLSPHWRLYIGVEGTQDEIELITEFQWHISKKVFIKLNNAFGVTSKATDWAPEIGIMFRF
jgi:hypothetical protein